MEIEKIIKEFPKGILNWYDIRKDSKILLVESQNRKCDFIRELFKDRTREILCVSMEDLMSIEKKYQDYFDYVITIGTLEYSMEPNTILKEFKELLNDQGTLLLAMDNRLGLRYFCGDRDPFTDRNFDGIENYRTTNAQMKQKCYAKYEITDMLEQAGFCNHKFYSVLPCIEMPQLIYAENFMPTEELDSRYFPKYHHPESVFLEERYLYKDLIKSGMFHTMANSFLIECSRSGSFSNVEHVTLSMDRGEENAFATVIRDDSTVEKCALYPKAVKNLGDLYQHDLELKKRGIRVIEAKLEDGVYKMPFVDHETALTYLRHLLLTDLDKFILKMDEFRDILLASSEPVENPVDESEAGTYYKQVYFDMVPLNCFVVDDEFMFYDQEFCLENQPIDLLVIRLIDIVYDGNLKREKILPSNFFLERYGLNKTAPKLRDMICLFLKDLRNQKELRIFNDKYAANLQTVNTNRQRVNYSQEEYNRLFIQLFDQTEDKKIYIFGSGSFGRKFLARFALEHKVEAVLDNNKSRWGSKVDGYPIISPEELMGLDASSYKVIICVKNYLDIMLQLENLGVKNMGVFDPYVDFPVELNIEKNENKCVAQCEQEQRKKYHVGYIAGVFDLFHIGHLNMFKRAKEQCEYLIVGVVSDEAVIKNKKVSPFIPFQERLELVSSCKYVDQAVEIPFAASGTRDAYRKYHFDCQFSGSDYEKDGDWLAEKAFLEKHGSTMEFFSYTEGTSSTKIKAMINKNLI